MDLIMNCPNQRKTSDTVVTMKVKGKVRTVEVHTNQWEKHKEEIKAYAAGSDIELNEGGSCWSRVYNPLWHMHKQYRVKVTKQPEAGQIWKNVLGIYLLYAEDSGMVNLDTGFTHPEYDLERLTFVCDHYTKIPQ